MSQERLKSPKLITTANEFKQLVDKLALESIIAVDTESNSLYAYQEQVCLIQFSTQQNDYLVDPLALDDISSLEPIFSSPQIEVIFHAAEYDLICLKRDFGFTFTYLFDTMVAARTLGRKEVGLGSLLKAEFGVTVEKKYQRANWGQRPLPLHMLQYAQLDTHYLIALRDLLKQELITKGRYPLAEEDFIRLCRVSEHNTEKRPADCWRINGAFDLDPQEAAVLKELCLFRDQIARRKNRPLFKVMNDQVLISLAERCPRNREELVKTPGLSHGQATQYWKGLLGAIIRGLQAEPLHPPAYKRPNNGFLERLEALKGWRKMTAREMGVNSDVVLPRDLMYAIAQGKPQHWSELKTLMDDAPYRYECFGDEIMVVIPGK
jgi:ribonuclease D